mmetsp:Transcript_19777/g.44148  ORF Transcript_19777/g.44148 Transcript_19777/m.44148 type:complete len:205 (-) Transcript_19777:1854-2468(-)
MDRLVHLSPIRPCQLGDRFRARRVLLHEAAQIVHFAVDGHPHIVLVCAELSSRYLTRRSAHRPTTANRGGLVHARLRRAFRCCCRLHHLKLYLLTHYGTEDGALEQRVTSQPVLAMHAAGDLPGRVQPRHDASVSTEYVTHLVESDATHAVVQHGHDPPHVQSLIQRDRRVVKVDLAKFIPALRRRRVVRRKGAFERIGERGGV